MTQPSFSGSLAPLHTDAMIEKRVHDIIGRASLRQLWFLFLDDEDMQLPLLIPIDGLPTRPEREGVHQVLANITALMAEIDATGLVMVWERYGPRTLTPRDRAWAHAFATECVNESVPLRAMLLSHRSGVRWIAPDDYIGEPTMST